MTTINLPNSGWGQLCWHNVNATVMQENQAAYNGPDLASAALLL